MTPSHLCPPTGSSASLDSCESDLLEAWKVLKTNRPESDSTSQALFRPNTDARSNRTSPSTNRTAHIAFIRSVSQLYRKPLDNQASVHIPFVLAHHLLLFQDSAMQNGYSNNDETVADIKERAKEKAFSVTKGRGISAHSLMRVAQDLASDAQKAEDSGDLKKSLELWVQASGLLSALFNTPDYKAEAQPGKRKEVKEWMQVSTLIALCFEWFKVVTRV